MEQREKSWKRSVFREKGRATRNKCLREGAEIFFSRRIALDPFKSVAQKEVWRRAGLTRNGFRRHWPTRAEYFDDLTAFLLAEGDIFKEDFERLRDLVESTRGLAPLEAIVKVSELDLKLLDSDVWRAMEILVTMYIIGNQQREEIARRTYRQVDEDTWNDVYGPLLGRAQRVPRPPFDGPAIGSVLQAFVEGAGIRANFDKGRFSDPSVLRGSQAAAYSLGVAALLTVLTMPENGSDTRSVEEVVASEIAMNRT